MADTIEDNGVLIKSRFSKKKKKKKTCRKSKDTIAEGFWFDFDTICDVTEEYRKCEMGCFKLPVNQTRISFWICFFHDTATNLPFRRNLLSEIGPVLGSVQFGKSAQF